jgi:hypothetical protein
MNQRGYYYMSSAYMNIIEHTKANILLGPCKTKLKLVIIILYSTMITSVFCAQTEQVAVVTTVGQADSRTEY